jgi:hypothetical protein
MTPTINHKQFQLPASYKPLPERVVCLRLSMRHGPSLDNTKGQRSIVFVARNLAQLFFLPKTKKTRSIPVLTPH